MRNRATPASWEAVVSSCVAAAVAVLGYYYCLKPLAWPPIRNFAAVGLIFALAALAAAGLMIGVARRSCLALSRRQASLCIFLGCVCGWGLVIVTPIMPPKSLMAEHWLQVIATGEKNPLSTSPAVWVAGLQDLRTRRFVADAYDFQHDGHWHAISPSTSSPTPSAR